MGKKINGFCSSMKLTHCFGKRSEVKDSHDRFANDETGNLLKRLYRFNGLALFNFYDPRNVGNSGFAFLPIKYCTVKLLPELIQATFGNSMVTVVP